MIGPKLPISKQPGVSAKGGPRVRVPVKSGKPTKEATITIILKHTILIDNFCRSISLGSIGQL